MTIHLNRTNRPTHRLGFLRRLRAAATVAFIGCCATGILADAGWAATRGAESVDKEESQPSADTLIEQLAKSVDTREPKAIREALVAIDTAFGDLSAEDDERSRERLARATAKMLDYPEPNENRVAFTAVDALGRMKRLGAEELARFVSEEDLDETELRSLRDFALDSLGKTRVPEAVPILTEYLKHHHVSAVSHAATALGRYGDAPGKLRKKIAEHLVRTAEYIDGRLQVQRTPGAKIEEEWRAAILPVYQALVSVTTVEKNSASGWRNWFENHKDESWEKGPDSAGS